MSWCRGCPWWGRWLTQDPVRPRYGQDGARVKAFCAKTFGLAAVVSVYRRRWRVKRDAVKYLRDGFQTPIVHQIAVQKASLQVKATRGHPYRTDVSERASEAVRRRINRLFAGDLRPDHRGVEFEVGEAARGLLFPACGDVAPAPPAGVDQLLDSVAVTVKAGNGRAESAPVRRDFRQDLHDALADKHLDGARTSTSGRGVQTGRSPNSPGVSSHGAPALNCRITPSNRSRSRPGRRSYLPVGRNGRSTLLVYQRVT
ncbi:hypothetical protein STXM2123_5144 [Streptomyces sp. F-3]|nr:hypothetical protein STXM2123_5144 [Streptomyces sp. F-3]